MKMANGKETVFEAVTCGRCGGSGEYSYCTMYGKVCFGCSGTGVKLTKRGLAASAFYQDLLKVRAADLVVGQKVLWEGFSAGSFSQPSFWLTVGSIEADPLNVGQLLVKGVNQRNGEAGTMGLSPDNKVRIAWSGADKLAKQTAAKAFQATLGKSGKPLKRKVTA